MGENNKCDKKKRTRESPENPNKTSKNFKAMSPTKSLKDMSIAEFKALLDDTLDEKVQHLATKDDVTPIKVQITELQANLKSTISRLDKIDRRDRFMTLIFNGLPKSDNNRQTLITFLENKFGIRNAEIRRIVHLRYSPDGSKCNLLVEFLTDEYVPQIFANISNLKDSGVTVDRNLSPVERQRRRKLLLIKNTITNQVRTAGGAKEKLSVSENMFKINDKKFRYHEEECTFKDINNVSLRDFIKENYNINVNNN